MTGQTAIDRDDILSRCRALGFALAGVCDASPSDRHAELREWLADGRHGEMHYLAGNTAIRTDPALIIDGGRARAFIMVADQYATRNDRPDPPMPPTRGRIARYARGEDYHLVMKERLHALCDQLRAQHPDHQFRAFVDTAPVPERELAARAGLGWIGKHTLLINPDRGSYLLLGGIATTMPLAPIVTAPEPDHCGTCTRCIDACPTDAISPYSVDARRCISYLTIEHRSEIRSEFHEAIGDWIFGCDVCQEVCPHNSPRSGAVETGQANKAYDATRSSFDLLDVLGWTPAHRAAATRRSALKRARLDMMKRNACIVAGNTLDSHRDRRLRTRVESIVDDSDQPELVRRAARTVVERPADQSR